MRSCWRSPAKCFHPSELPGALSVRRRPLLSGMGAGVGSIWQVLAALGYVTSVLSATSSFTSSAAYVLQQYDDYFESSLS
jgi:hypothetical protein